MKYKEWLKEWLTYYVKSAVKMKTYEKYSRQVNLYLVPYLGEYELEELSPLSLQKFAVSLSERGAVPEYGERDHHSAAIVAAQCCECRKRGLHFSSLPKRKTSKGSSQRRRTDCTISVSAQAIGSK